LIVLKKVNQELSQDDIKTLKSIHEAWQEIESGKGEKAKDPNSLWNLPVGNYSNNMV